MCSWLVTRNFLFFIALIFIIFIIRLWRSRRPRPEFFPYNLATVYNQRHGDAFYLKPIKYWKYIGNFTTAIIPVIQEFNPQLLVRTGALDHLRRMLTSQCFSSHVVACTSWLLYIGLRDELQHENDSRAWSHRRFMAVDSQSPLSCYLPKAPRFVPSFRRASWSSWIPWTCRHRTSPCSQITQWPNLGGNMGRRHWLLGRIMLTRT